MAARLAPLALAAVVATAVVFFRRRRRPDDGKGESCAGVASACTQLVDDFGTDTEGAREFVDDALGHCAAEGLLFLRYAEAGPVHYGASPRCDANFKLDKWRIAPAALLPATIDSDFFKVAKEVTSAMVRLLEAADLEWLDDAFGALAKSDGWTRKMLAIARLELLGDAKPRCLCARADFMLDSATRRVVNIEVNPFAASLAAQAEALSAVHRRLVGKYSTCSKQSVEAALPQNCAGAGLADALAGAAALYRGANSASRRCVVLFVTIAEEDNEIDHRKLETRLWDTHGIASLRRTVSELVGESRFEHGHGTARPRLVVGGDEVAVAYFRLCNWHAVQGGWALREALAASATVEVPSAAVHLAGLKRSQVNWSKRNKLAALGQRTGLRRGDVELLLAVSAPQFSLDDPEDVEAVSKLVAGSPGPLVAKPARDGGCGGRAHTFDPFEIADFVRRAQQGDVAAMGWVVQQVAVPAAQQSLVLGAGATCAARPSVPELGIFATGFGAASKFPQAVTKDSCIVVAARLRSAASHLDVRVVGHLVRSKHQETLDGGLCRGNAVLDSPLLTKPLPADAAT